MKKQKSYFCLENYWTPKANIRSRINTKKTCISCEPFKNLHNWSLRASFLESPNSLMFLGAWILLPLAKFCWRDFDSLNKKRMSRIFWAGKIRGLAEKNSGQKWRWLPVLRKKSQRDVVESGLRSQSHMPKALSQTMNSFTSERFAEGWIKHSGMMVLVE